MATSFSSSPSFPSFPSSSSPPPSSSSTSSSPSSSSTPPFSLFPPGTQQHLIESDEQYIRHGIVTKVTRDDPSAIRHHDPMLLLLLTSKSLYELDALDPRKLLRRIDLRETHDIAAVLEQAMTIRLVLLSPLSSGPVKVKMEGWGSGDSLVSYARAVDYIVQSEQALADWLLAGTHTINRFWQRMFEVEKKITSPGEVFQGKFFLTKVNRMGKLQLRALVISTRNLYNVAIKEGTLEVGKVKWHASLEGVQKLLLFKKDPRAFTVFLQTSDSGRNKEDATFVCRNESEVEDVVNEIRRLFMRVSGQELTVEELS